MAISRVDFWSFIIELVTRNPSLGIPPPEDGLCFVIDIVFFSAFLKVYRPREVSHFCFSRNFLSNAVRIISGDPLGPEL